MNAELLGEVVGGVLAVIIVAAVVILLTVFCLYRRYHRTAKTPLKKIEQ